MKIKVREETHAGQIELSGSGISRWASGLVGKCMWEWSVVQLEWKVRLVRKLRQKLSRVNFT